MAGKPKKRIDYAGWSVDIFSTDTKIDKLLDAQGWTGFGIYFYLCQMAFGSEGYFYEWCYDLCATTARKMGGGVGAGTVKETVDYCLQIGLFDKGLFDRWGVLTSRGIQKSYLVVLKSKKRTGTEIIEDYWLLGNENKEDFQGVIFVRKNKEEIRENADSLRENADSLGGNADSRRQKESKVKESKGKDMKVHSNVCPELDELAPNSNIKIPLNDKTFYYVPLEKIELWKEAYQAVDVEQELKKMVAWCDSNPTRRKTKRGITKFINGWLSRKQDESKRYSNLNNNQKKFDLKEWGNE